MGDDRSVAVVDRIEGPMAVVEFGGVCVNIPLLALPQGLKEGDRLEVRVLPSQEISQIAENGEAAAVLERLKKRFPQGPDSFDL
jgi:hypothetical protein